MKRLLYIQYCFGTGGINKITSVKENYFVNHGYEVHNLSLIDVDERYADLYDKRIICHSLHLNQLGKWHTVPVVGKIGRYICYRWRLFRAIIQINPDTIIVNQPTLEPLEVVLLTWWKRRIMEFHGWYNHPETTSISWRQHTYYFLTSPFYQMVALTKGEADKLKRLTDYNALFIPNPLYSFPQQVSSCDNKRVISMARFTSQKKLEAVIPSWKIVEEKHPDWELHLYGEGPDEPKMRHAIETNELKTVFIHPYTSRVEEEMAKASVYIFPSMFEGFGLVLLEAMSAGVPCVTYDCPCGPAEIVRNGEDGFVTEYKNPQALIDKVLYLIEHETERKEMGRKARENIKRYNMDSIMQQWKDLFNHS